MNDPDFLPDDPKLTAYALGELTGDERAEMEAVLRQNPVLRAHVEEIRATAAQLEAALAAEAAAEEAPEYVTANGHHVDEDIAERDERVMPFPGRDWRERRGSDGGNYASARRSKLLSFPQLYYVVGGLAAACVAVMVVLHREQYVAAQQARIAQAAIAQKNRVAAEASATARQTIQVELRDPTIADTVGNSGPIPAVASVDAPATRVREPRRSLLPGTLSLFDQVKHAAAWERDREVALVVDMSALTGRGGGDASEVDSVRFEHADAAKAIAAQESVAGGAEKDLNASAIAHADDPNVRAAAASDAAAPASEPVTAAPAFASVVVPGGLSNADPGNNEIVLLQPFLVSAVRDRGYAASAPFPSFTSIVPDDEFDHRPLPPPGARFGRNNEAYMPVPDNPFQSARRNSVSTFAIDSDTASYAHIREMIARGIVPPRDSVRIEELLNYFPYRYELPKDDTPFAASLEVAAAPWAPEHRLVRIGLKGREVAMAERAPASLVFLLDVSSSMDEANKLPLVKESMRLLLGRLRPDDRVAIVTYAGHSGLALPSTPVSRLREILNAVEALAPGGSGQGAQGIRLAYDVAHAHFAPEGVNRVIVCTDGDFNLGPSSESELVRLVEEKARAGVSLSVLGFGMGNYKDATLEKLATKGNGHYGYIDTRREAEKLLVRQIEGTLVTIAKDVKIQVRFNPAKVASYRLIGYENRLLNRDDFSDDTADGGEIGAGHTVTALYEVVPVGVKSNGAGSLAAREEPAGGDDDALSARMSDLASGSDSAETMLTVRVRFKKPNAFLSWRRTLEYPLVDPGTKFGEASDDFRFAAAVAQYGMILRDSPHKGNGSLADVIAWADDVVARTTDDPGGYRAEFVDLVRKTQVLLQ